MVLVLLQSSFWAQVFFAVLETEYEEYKINIYSQGCRLYNYERHPSVRPSAVCFLDDERGCVGLTLQTSRASFGRFKQNYRIPRPAES